VSGVIFTIITRKVCTVFSSLVCLEGEEIGIRSQSRPASNSRQL